jgi:flagellar motor switch protein FliN/FliY
VNLFCEISPQSKSGGGGGIQKSGYDGSQLGVFDSAESDLAGSVGGSDLGGSDLGGSDFGGSVFVLGGTYS